MLKRLHLKDAILDDEAMLTHIISLYWSRWFEAFYNAAHKYYEENCVVPYES